MSKASPCVLAAYAQPLPDLTLAARAALTDVLPAAARALPVREIMIKMSSGLTVTFQKVGANWQRITP